MAKRKSRRAGRRIKDKWKSKSWFRITAPQMFEGAVVGETPASNPEDLLGRVTEISLQDLTSDYSKVHIKAQFKINGVRGGECLSRFIGHDMTTDYIRRMTRRRRSKIDSVFDVKTKEGYKVRVKILAITDKRINSSIKRSIRNRQEEILEKVSSESTLSEFVKQMLFGGLAKKIKNDTKDIYPLKRVETRKSEVLSVPKEEELEEKIISEEEVEEEEEVKEEVEVEVEEEIPTKPEVLEQFQNIEGVGPTMAEKLYDGGYNSLAQLKEASKEELEKVEGVGPAFSEKIIKALNPKD
ncbi:MAG: 30S ribosomal protein S3ae [Thermoplasmatota archaeon]